MVTQSTTVRHEVGLHARPAAQFAKLAQRFNSDITVHCKSRSANAKSILSILGLGVTQNTTIEISAEGQDSEEAVKSLISLVERNFENRSSQ